MLVVQNVETANGQSTLMPQEGFITPPHYIVLGSSLSLRPLHSSYYHYNTTYHRIIITFNICIIMIHL